MSSLTRHILTLSSGTAMASILTLAMTPILTRFYSPEAFGKGEMLNLLSALMALLLSLRLDAALIFKRTEEEASRLFSGILTLGCFGTCFFLILAGISALNSDKSIYLILPLSAFSIMTYESLIWLLNRNSEYKFIAQTKILFALSINGMKILLALFLNDERGLVLGAFTGQALVTLPLLFYFIQRRNLKLRIDPRLIISSITENKDLPQKNLPILLVNQGKDLLLNAVILKTMGPGVLGMVVLALKLLKTPVIFLGNSISNIIYRKLSEDESVDEQKATYLYFFYVSLIIAGCFIAGSILAPYAIRPLFGERWEAAGTYIRILAPVYFLTLVYSTIEKVAILTCQQGFVLATNIFTELLSLATLWLAAKHFGPVETLICYVGVWVVPKIGFILFFISKRKISLASNESNQSQEKPSRKEVN